MIQRQQYCCKHQLLLNIYTKFPLKLLEANYQLFFGPLDIILRNLLPQAMLFVL